MDLTVLGCSGSYGGPPFGACSSYLVRDGDTSIWLDCGNGSFANLQEHLDPRELTAVVISHRHPDHCVDLYGFHIACKYAYGRSGVPVYAAPEVREHLDAIVDGRWGGAFDWHRIDEGDEITIGSCALRFSRTDHPPPTLAVECRVGDRRFVYSSDTGPGWGPQAFGPGAQLAILEATYQDARGGPPLHCSASGAAAAAQAAGAERLMITHVFPTLDPEVSLREAAAVFHGEVLLAAPHLTVTV